MKLLDYYTVQDEERQSRNIPALRAAALADNPWFLDQFESLIPMPGARFSGDLLVVVTGSLYDQLASVCRFYLESTPGQRAYLRSQIDTARNSLLQSYALRAATLGLRKHHPGLVRLALAAYALRDIIDTPDGPGFRNGPPRKPRSTQA